MAGRSPFVVVFAFALGAAFCQIGSGTAGSIDSLADCSTGQLRATAAFEGETGSEVGGVSLRNYGARACRLPRSPILAVFWKHERLRLHQSPFNDYQPNANQQRVSVLRPGQWAFVPIAWSNWCGGRPWGNGFFTPYLRLALGGLAQLTVRLRHPTVIPPPRCDSPGDASTFKVGLFYTPLPTGWNP